MPVIILASYIGTTTAPPAVNVTGFDPYFDNVITLMHMDSANGSTAFIDQAGQIVTSGGAVATTTNKKYGTASFNPATGYATFPYQTFQPTSGVSFTIEMWVYPTGNHSFTSILGYGAGDATANAVYWQFGLTSTNLVGMYFYTGSQNSITSSSAVPLNTWSHIAFVNNAGAATIFINGVSAATGTFATPAANTQAITLGQVANNKFVGLIDDLRVTNGVARYSTAFTPSTIAFPDSFSQATYDPLFDNTSALVNAESSVSTDATGKVTFSTATVPTSAIKRFGNNSLAFAGSTATQLLSTTSTAFNAQGTLTIEAWVYPTAFGATRQIVASTPTSAAGGPRIRIISTGVVQYVTNIVRITSPAPLPLNTWSHIAVSLIANVGIMYINGVQQVASGSMASTFTDVGLFIGSNGDGSEPFQGYIDDVRITKAARYPSAFTPVKAAFATKSVATDMTFDPYAPSTVLQMRMDGTNGSTAFTEDTGKVVTVAASGVSMSTTQVKYGTTAASFNGVASNYLSVPYSADFAFGAGEFTIEGWIYLNAYQATDRCQMIANWHGGAGAACAFGFGVLATGYANLLYNASANITATVAQVPLNQWVHLAFVRVGNVGFIYQNGKQVGTGALTATLNAGDLPICIGGHSTANWVPNGYLDDVRVTKGVARYLGEFTPPTAQVPALTSIEYIARYGATDPHAANVVFQMGFDGVRPTDTTGFATPATVTAVTPSTVVFAEGGAGLFNGTSSAVLMPNNARYSLGTGDFCLEAWVYMTAYPSGRATVVTTGASATDTAPLLNVNANGTLGFQTWNTVIINSTNTVPLNTWTHIALTRASSTVQLFVNGVQGGSVVRATNYTDPGCSVGSFGGSSQFFPGYIDNVRITKGEARYTANFTPSIL